MNDFGVEPATPSDLHRRNHLGTHLGTLIVNERLHFADNAGLHAVYLLTTTAPALFCRLGFLPLDRAEVPLPAAASPEFASICPAAAVMSRATRPRPMNQ